jgi:hypothetical protein
MSNNLTRLRGGRESHGVPPKGQVSNQTDPG